MPVSYSQLQSYRRCPKQYEYSFVKKLGRPISRGESFGASIHNALKRWGELEIQRVSPKSQKKQLTLFLETQAPPPPSDLTVATLLTFLRECFIAEGYGSSVEMDAALKRGEEALRHFFQWWGALPRTVVDVEKSFKYSVPDTPDLVLNGRFDRVEQQESGLHIIDFKTSGPRDQKEMNTDLQLSIYALAAKEIWNKPVATLTLLSVTEEGITEQSTVRSQSELLDAIKSIRLIHERIRSGDFAATPSVPVCKYCPYREICPVRAI